MIQCPNHTCQAANAETERFCYRCRAPLPRRLLWAVGHQVDTFSPGEILSDRYLCKASRIFLDQQPGIPPGTLADVPKAVLPYLHLISHQVHLPQVYGWVDAELQSGGVTRLLLLENAALLSTVTTPTHAYPIDLTRTTDPDIPPKHLPCLLPSLQRAWPHAAAAQQLNWLWQLARLWAPLAAEQVAATLLKEHLIRVEGPLIRLLELRFGLNTTMMSLDQVEARPSAISAPTLVQLGTFWSGLMAQAAPEIQDFGQSICQQMIEGYLTDSAMLQDILTDAIHQSGRSQTLRVSIATQTDKGPSRSDNEDACFPPEGSVMALQDRLEAQVQEDTGLVIVCDGIGGHQGGAVASDLAIKAIAQQVRHSNHQSAEISAIQSDLKLAVAQANDVISQNNDDKQRRDRQRMGTTVVMGLLHGHDCYIAHVGDSRAYWVTQWGCHQLTLDDDVVSRETRLGYGTYRSILYQPNSGALVQALGMGPSKNLYPTVQRLMLAGEGLLLLCSDGLSDQDLIEACWEEVLRPVLLGNVADLGSVSQRLVDLANTHNGHDNVTVGIMHWSITQTAPIQLDAVTDLSEFITQELEGDRPNPSRRPITGLAPLPDSLEIRGIAHPNARSSYDQGTVPPSDEGTASNSGSHGSQADLLDNPDAETANISPLAIGLQGLKVDAPIPTLGNESDPTSDNPADASSSASLLLQMMIVAVAIASLGMVSLLAYVWIPDVSDRVNAILGIESPPHDIEQDRQEQDEYNNADEQDLILDSSAPAVADPSFGIGSVVQIKPFPPVPSPDNNAPLPEQSSVQPLLLLTLEPMPSEQGSTPSSPVQVPSAQILGAIPGGSVLTIRGSFEVPEQGATETRPEGQAGGDRPIDASSPGASSPGASAIDNTSPNASATNRSSPTVVDSRAAPDDGIVLLAGRWLEVQLCTVPPTSNSALPTSTLAPGAIGWVSESDLKTLTHRQLKPPTDPNNPCTLAPDQARD
ncbi:MAG: hypothetical protein F6K30_17525 [Cyanothece sp. SIO2G6]|nr:hypothetical protein [Cyanothece sp. SIO2G6]